MNFIWPIDAPRIVTRDFYFLDPLYLGGQHAAIDIITDGRPTTGEPVRAVADGTAYASPIKDFYSGWNVYVDHADNWRSGYRHFEHQILPPGVPIPVKQGDILGYADSTGTVTGPHLHFDLWNRDQLNPDAFYKVGWWAQNPEQYLEEVDLATLAELEARIAKLEFETFEPGGINAKQSEQIGNLQTADETLSTQGQKHKHKVVIQSMTIPGEYITDSVSGE